MRSSSQSSTSRWTRAGLRCCFTSEATCHAVVQASGLPAPHSPGGISRRRVRLHDQHHGIVGSERPQVGLDCEEDSLALVPTTDRVEDEVVVPQPHRRAPVAGYRPVATWGTTATGVRTPLPTNTSRFHSVGTITRSVAFSRSGQCRGNRSLSHTVCETNAPPATTERTCGRYSGTRCTTVGAPGRASSWGSGRAHSA